MDFLTKYSQVILGILRIVVGAQFLQHGLSKIAGFPLAPGGHAVVLMSFPGGASGLIELAAGALILLGLFSRVAASPRARWRWPISWCISPEASIPY